MAVAPTDEQLELLKGEAPSFWALFERSPEAMLLLAGDRFVACNAAAAAMLGYPDKSQLLLCRPEDISPLRQPDGQPSAAKRRALIEAALAQGSLRFEWEHRRHDGAALLVEVLLTALPLTDRTLLHVAWRELGERAHSRGDRDRTIAGYRQELARRRQITQAMHDILTLLTSSRPLEEMLDYLVGHAVRLLGADGAAIYQLDAGGQTLRIVAEQGVGWPGGQLSVPIGIGITGRAIVGRRPLYVSDAPAWLAAERDAWFLQGHPTGAHFIPRFQSACAIPLLMRGELYGALTAYYGRPHSFGPEESRLIEACADYAALAIEHTSLRSRVEQAATAAERSRLARELHDAVSQTLFSASLIADVLPRLWARDPALGARRLEEVRQLTRSAVAEMRALLLELRPDALVEMPFAALLSQLGEAVRGRAGVQVLVQIEPAKGELRLAPELQVALYRIVQEALHNAARHARATAITLRCQITCDEQVALGEPAPRPAVAAVELQVRDDGVGFDPRQLAPGHLGLRTMRERAQAVGAELQLTSAPGQGTTLVLRWAAAPQSCPTGEVSYEQ
jgi:signal transduction histidine kinase